MSPTLGPGKTTWSDCSRQYLDKFVLTPQATCVLGRSSHVNIIHQFIPHHQLPGERFNVEDQCRFRFGAQAKHSAGQPMSEICRVIKCRVKSHIKNGALYSGRSLYQYPSKSTYNTHPALEGTDCGTNKWCREGRCVSKQQSDNFVKSSKTNLTTSTTTTTELSNDLDNYLAHHFPQDQNPLSVPKIELSRNRINNNNNNRNNRHSNQKKSKKSNNNNKNYKSTPAPSDASEEEESVTSSTSAPTTVTPTNSTSTVSFTVLGSTTRRTPTTILIKEPSPYRYRYNQHNNRFVNNNNNDFSRKNQSSSVNSLQDGARSKDLESDVDYLLSSSYRKHNPYNDKPQTIGGNSEQSARSHRWQSSRLSNSGPSSGLVISHNRPINGNWSNWSEFGPCISECVAPSGQSTPFGVMSALRRCTNPEPAHGGYGCRGSDTRVKICNAAQVCSIESAISAASGPGATRVSFNQHLDSNNSGQRYRIRTVDEYIEDTCTSAAKSNDKIEGHGTQYPSYNSASHSCYVWCHKRGGGFLSQGWRLPDGTPCGQKLHVSTSSGLLLEKSVLNSKTGYCYNGQCKSFNCHGEMLVRQLSMSSSSTNVYNGANNQNNQNNTTPERNAEEFSIDNEMNAKNHSDHCGTIAAFYTLLNIDLSLNHKMKDDDEDDKRSGNKDNDEQMELSYRLVTMRPKHTVPRPGSTAQHHPTALHTLPPPPAPQNTPHSSTTPEFGPTMESFRNGITSSPVTPPSYQTPAAAAAPPNSFQSYQSSGMSNRHGSNLAQHYRGYSNWSDWTPVTECQYSTACITTGRGFRLVTRECQRQTCTGRREALQVCEEITATDDIRSSPIAGQDPALYDLYEQYCPSTKRRSSNQYAAQICLKYQIKYPSLLSGSGRQLLGNKNSGCIVACEDRVWKDIHYQMDAFEDGKFPFGTDCSSGGQTGYCLNGKCIHFDQKSISFDTPESVLYRSEILQLFAPETTPIPNHSPPDTPELILFNHADVSPKSRTVGTTVDDPARVYSTISNELYKRATIAKHATSPQVSVPVPIPPPGIPNFGIQMMAPPVHGTPQPIYPYSMMESSPMTQTTMSMLGAGNDGQFGQYGTRLESNFVPPPPPPLMKRRYKRSTNNKVFYGPIVGGGVAASAGSQISRFSLSSAKKLRNAFPAPSQTNLYRKATIQETNDPEADYVSWQLTSHHTSQHHNRNHRNHRRRGTNINPNRPSSSSSSSSPIPHKIQTPTNLNWRPIKKSLRPINLSDNSGSRVVRFPENFASLIGSKKRFENQPMKKHLDDNSHFRTFTLVKHSGMNRLNLSANRNFNQIALPLKNHTRFLDDDEEDDDQEEVKKHGKQSSNSTTIKNQLSLNKKKVMFSLGHESWPPSTDERSHSYDYRTTNSGEDNDEDDEEEERNKETEIRVEPYVWSVILSECSRHCGQGIRTVRVVCTVGQKTIDDRLCEQDQKPTHKPIEPCKERDCVGTWRAEPWSQCSAKCGRNSYQSRTIICVGPAGGGKQRLLKKRQVSIDENDDEMDEVPFSLMVDNDNDDSSATTVTTLMPLGPTTTESSIDQDQSMATTTTESTVEHSGSQFGTSKAKLQPPQQAPPSEITSTRVFSILSHNYCDLDTKPVQWRSCHMSNCAHA